jgi:hypothetical protein
VITLRYAEFTEESNALDYLEKAVTFIKCVDNKPQNWKWVILCTFGALYGFLVCALKGTNPEENVCHRTKKGQQKLIGFPDVLKRCQDSGWMNRSGFTKVLELAEDQKNAVDRIHAEFRNGFEHYRPALWCIELSGMPEIVKEVLDVIRFVSLDMGCYYVHYGAGDREKIANLVAQGKDALQNLSVAMNAS